MANTDITRKDKLAQKRSISVFANLLREGEEIAGASDNYLLANLPANAVIIDASIQVLVGSDAATSAVATLGTTEGGTEILSAADLTTVGAEGTYTGDSATDTGVQLFLGVTTVGATTEIGKYVVRVDYVEYDKSTGEYTQL